MKAALGAARGEFQTNTLVVYFARIAAAVRV